MERNIKVFSLPTCSKCQILKKILDAKEVKYEVEENMDKINEKAMTEGLSQLPILVVIDDKETVYSGSEAVMYGKEL